MENKKNILYFIIGIIIIILAIFGINLDNITTNEVTNNSETSQNSAYKYETLNIDKEKLNIFYLNVGQADSTLIIMDDNVMLIDAGNKTDGAYISEFMKAQGISQIDYLIETHVDSDHSGGMETIVNNFDIITMYMPQSAIAECSFSSEVNIQIFTDLDNIYTLGDSTWQVLSVNNDEEVTESQENDTSIVIQLTYEDTKFLFMGDASSKVEKDLLNSGKLDKIDVLKVGHHGSSSSSSQEFLNTILPTYSVISVNNSEYNKHPSSDTIERLENINSVIYRTDENGTIWATSDGSSVLIEELDINVNGANRTSRLESIQYSLIFYCKIFPSLSTTL